MLNIHDILLKLHYLKIEVHTIYQVLQKLYQYKAIDERLLESILEDKYQLYKKINIYQIKDELFSNNIAYKTIICEDYPKSLQTIFMPPLVLFYQGNYQLIHTPSLAVIGTRNNTDYGKKACEYLVKELVNQNLTIISGLAKGIDCIAHQTTIRHSGKTIAVLGSGLMNVYPKENHALARVIASEHLMLSEYPPYEPPMKTHFPFRNRIVSGLSNGILVIEAKQRSGTLITCDYALDQGKDIYVVPGSIFNENSEGTNNLIKQGAKIITSIKDILEFFVR